MLIGAGDTKSDSSWEVSCFPKYYNCCLYHRFTVQKGCVALGNYSVKNYSKY